MGLHKILPFVLGPIGAAALGLLSVPMMTWLFTAEDIGAMSLVVVIASFCNLFFTLGLDQAYVREYYVSQNKPKLLKMTFLPGFLMLVSTLIILSLFSSVLLQAAFGLTTEWLFLLISLHLLTIYISRYIALILRMQGRGFAFSLVQFLPKLLLILIFTSYFLLSIPVGFTALISANLFSLMLIILFYVWNTKEEWTLALASIVNKSELQSMLRFGAPLIFASLSFWGMTSLDRVFIRYYAGFEELGIYTVAVNFAGAAIILQSVFSTVWSPMVYKWIADGDDLKKVFGVTNWMLAIIGLSFSLAGLFSWIIPYILPSEYVDVQYIFVACLGYPLFYTLSETTVVGIGVSRKTKYAMFSGLIVVFFNVIFNYLLVPLYGAKGAAISTMFSFWIFFVCRTEFASMLWIKLDNRIKYYVITFVYMSVVVYFTFFGGDNVFIDIVAFLVVFVGSFIATLVLFIKYKKVEACAKL